MSMVRWDPFRELDDMTERLNRLFGRSLPARTTETGREALTVPDWSPVVDIAETPEEYVIKADLPDVKKENVKVTVEAGVLKVEGERRRETEEKNRKYHRVERSYGSFMRSFVVPETVDPSKVRADFKDGVLHLHLPKSEKAASRSIDVKVS